ncbi:MAG TPA: hypothetical protein VE244_00300 [Nitrososphaeraceae archaeon]|nr:hypothetical protein [Nitrososphaeraceae archaeon]
MQWSIVEWRIEAPAHWRAYIFIYDPLTESSLGYQSMVSSKEISLRTLNYQNL